MIDLTLAAACSRARLGQTEANLAELARLTEVAVARGAEMILFPEACLTGYGAGDDVRPAAQPLDGPALTGAIDLAARFKATLVVGLMELGPDDSVYLTQALIDPADGLIGVYRKIHLGPTETDRFTAGSNLDPVCRPQACFGLQLCYDGHFPELSTIQVGRGAEVLLVAHASPGMESAGAKRDRWLRYLPARAYDNTAYLAACNLVGDNGRGLDFAGVALIIGPKGEVLAEHVADEPGLAVAHLPAAYLSRIRSSSMGHFWAARRPELYRPVSESDS